MIRKITKDDDVISLEVDHFDLEQTLECGQCFRWDLIDKNHYIGVAKGKLLELKQEGNIIHILNSNKSELKDIWADYFDLDRDYRQIINTIANEEIMADAIKYGHGMRILNQDEWETLVSFIISANNNIPRIKKIIGKLCQKFGNRIEYKGNAYYTFPTPAQLKDVTVEDLDGIKSGYRAKYIVDAVDKVNSGQVDLYKLTEMDTKTAKKELMKIKGVGPKVSDCILLYSMKKYECYPTDVWIRKVTEDLYLKRKSSLEEIHEFAKNSWGKYAGFAQQYLFYYARNTMTAK